MGDIVVDDDMTTEQPTTEEPDQGFIGDLFPGFEVNVYRTKLIFGGVLLTFFLTSVVLFLCEYKRRRRVRLKEIAFIRQEDPDAEFDDENETFWIFLKNNLQDLRDSLPDCDCCRSDKEKFLDDDDDDEIVIDGEPAGITQKTPLHSPEDMDPPEYHEIDDFPFDDYARAPEASIEDSMISSEDRRERPSDLALTPSSLEESEDRELKILSDIAAAGERSRKQLKKQKSEERMKTQIEIIFNSREEKFEMHEIDDDHESESWFAEKCVEKIPDEV
ncbi:uncharacterized protein [Amphiura filiformis]|uniref:uncharacterized protein n=1 Tax=Amphiura filiformis TaxID=82378 RepID=UPI003B21D611